MNFNLLSQPKASFYCSFELPLFICSLTLLICIIVADGPRSYKALALLAVSTVCSFLAVVFRLRFLDTIALKTTGSGDEDDDEGKYDDSQNALKEWSAILHDLFIRRKLLDYTSIVFLSSIIYFFTLFICLLAYEGTRPQNVDFGWKYGQVGRENIAFVPEFSTYTHFVQGILAGMFIFPAVSGNFARIPNRFCKESEQRPNFILLSIGNLFATAMSIYPTYNFIKRINYTAIKSHGVFARSSYLNNGAEWSLGSVTGLSIGYMSTNLLYNYLLTKDGDIESLKKKFLVTDDKESYAYGRLEEYSSILPKWWVKTVQIISYFLATIFFCCVIVSIIMIAATYNNTLE